MPFQLPVGNRSNHEKLAFSAIFAYDFLRLAARNLKGTSKNYPFGFWADLLPQQCVLKSPQYTKYSGDSKTFVGTKSLVQNTKK